MSEPLQLILHLSQKPDAEDAVQNLARTVPETVHREEPGTTEYVWLRHEGTDDWVFVDRYASSEAFLAHLGNMKEHGHLDAIMGAFDITSVHCLGTPTAEARAALDGLGATYLSQVAGFTRLEAPGMTTP